MTSPPRLASLAAIQAAVWSELESACADRAHPWRTPVLATVDGDLADARVVILREANLRAQCLLFFTDERAGKVAQLLAHPLGTLVMWSPNLGWQLRCRVELALETPGLATSSRWARVKLSPAAHDYLSPLPPGTVIDPDVTPTHEGIARDYFAVMSAQVRSLDWLELHPLGHRRARFDPAGGHWLQP